jgi:hypothetical protein
MSWRIRWESVVAGVVVLVSPRWARAQASEPGLTTVDPREHGVAVAQAPPVAPVGDGSTHVFDAFRHHADDMRTRRIASGASSMIFGGVFIGTGLYVEQAWHREFGTVLWVVGAIGIAGGGLTLLFKTDIENLADEHGVETTSKPSAEQESELEQDWQKAAAKAKGGRQLGGAIGIGLSAVAVGAAVVVVAADGINEETRRWLAPTLIVSAAATGAGAMVTLMVESPTEIAYGAYRATRGRSGAPASGLTRWRVSAAPLPNGGFVGVSANF